MKRPNGYGSIKKLAGNRRRPFVFVITQNRKQKPIAYFSSYQEAEIYSANYNKNNINCNSPTFLDVYVKWLDFHVSKKAPAPSTVANYKNAFNHCRPLWYKEIKTIKFAQYQSIIDNMQGNKLSYSSLKKVRSLISLVLNYAIMQDYTSTNYARLLLIGKNKPIYPHKPFTTQKINKLWKMDKTIIVSSVLILLYTGLRIGELLSLDKSSINLKQKTIKVKTSKTQAGIRTIPIHPRIYPLIIELTNNNKYLFEQYNYSRYKLEFNKLMQKLRANYRPHDTRHTFATLLDNADVSYNAKRLLLGHSSNNVTDGVYTHKNLTQLRKAINKLK